MAEEQVEVPKVSRGPSVASTVGFFAGQTGLTRRIVAEIVWPKDSIAIEDEQLPTMIDFGLLVSLSFQNCCGDQTLRLVTPKRVEGLETCVFSLCLEEEEKVVGLAYNEARAVESANKRGVRMATHPPKNPGTSMGTMEGHPPSFGDI